MRVSRLTFAVVLIASPTLAAAQALRTEAQPVDYGAFRDLPGAERLSLSRPESLDAIDLPVRTPVIGLGDILGEPFLGLEADDDLAETFIYDEKQGFWTSQQVEIAAGTVFVNADPRTAVATGIPGADGVFTADDPQIQFIGEDAVEIVPGAQSPPPTEVVASFAIGGLGVSVTLACRPGRIALCGTETEIRRLVDGLEVLGRGTLR